MSRHLEILQKAVKLRRSETLKASVGSGLGTEVKEIPENSSKAHRKVVQAERATLGEATTNRRERKFRFKAQKSNPKGLRKTLPSGI